MRDRGVVVLLLGVLWLGVGCGDDGTGSVDGGPPDATGDASDAGPDADPVTPTPPAEAALPDLAPCASGWREVVDADGVTLCEPWPETGRPACATPFEAALPGEPSCAPLGAACPAGLFAAGLPSDVVYVDAAAAPGGDGSLSSPHSTIAEALATVVSGGTIALAKGTHLGSVALDVPVSLVGACAAETRIEPATPSEDDATLSAAAAVELRDLTVTGDAPALRVSGPDGRVSASGLVIEGTVAYGISVGDGGTFEGRDVAIRRTRADSTGMRGYALDLEGGTATIRRAELAENTSRAIYARGAGTSLSVEDSSIRDTRSQPLDGNLGGAMDALGGVDARFTRTVFENNRDKNVRIDGEGTTLAFEDCVVRGGLPREGDDYFGFGLGVASGAHATVTRTLFENNQTVSVATQNEGTLLTLTDVVIRDTGPNPADGDVGTGLDLQSGAEVIARRLYVARSTYQGIRLTGVLSSLDAEDLTLVETQPHAVDGLGGFGLAVFGSQAVVRRARMARNRAVHTLVMVDGRAELEDVVMTDGLSQAADGLMGAGLMTYEGGRATLVRARFSNLKAVALWSTTRGDITGTDIEVAGVVPADCVVDTCAENPGGFGAVATLMATLSLSRFVLSDTALCGLSIGETSELVVSGGWIRNSAIGINLQNPSIDIAEIQRQITFTNNDQNLDTSVLSPPSSAVSDL